MIWKEHDHCRACGSGGLTQVLSLGDQPMANDFRKRAGHIRVPLHVLFCNKCTLAQLSVVVDPQFLYSQYTYVTPPSQSMLNHVDRLMAEIETETGKGSVIEIGSNDGLFLDHLTRHGFGPVLGVDPATNLCKLASNRGIKTLNKPFSRDTAIDIGKRADVVIARHVFAHVDNWIDFMQGLELVTHENSLVVLEFPYAKDMVENGHWDSIYHEHLSYISLFPLDILLHDTAFTLYNVLHYPVHSGSLVVMLRNKKCDKAVDQSVTDFLSHEPIRENLWHEFSKHAHVTIKRLGDLIRSLSAVGQSVAGYGAPAKATVVINACGWDKSNIRYVTDTTPIKIDTVVPGTDIPVVGDDELLKGQPDYAVMFAHNYAPDIIRAKEQYLERRGRFIIPVPHVKII